ncbi:hypothetical protein AB0J74_20405 [Asanoa sp. NPDC049573]|uniref:hypothetical protein n=1 Tax=Asanoa sp. NPDC049573 TaxID=3155396 RepID=UPI003434D097
MSNGDPLLAGQVNTSPTTTIRSASTEPTLTLANENGPALRLVTGNDYTIVAEPGTVAPNHIGLRVSFAEWEVPWETTTNILNNGNALMPVAVPPTRVLDTRNAAGRDRLIDGRSDIDAQGRAVGGAFLVVDVGGLVSEAQGLFATVTVTKTASSGYATVWGTGQWPRTSTINWWDKGQVLSNGVLSQCGWYDVNGKQYNTVVAVYVSAAAAIVLDVTGFLVGDPQLVASEQVPSTSRASAGARTTIGRRPERGLVRR